MVVALIIGIAIGTIGCFAVLVVIGRSIARQVPPDPEVLVHLYALRRRRELDQFKRETKTEARRLRHELRQEMRMLDEEWE